MTLNIVPSTKTAPKARKPRAPKKIEFPENFNLKEQRFVAVDFETANTSRSSACAISLIVVDCGEIVDTFTTLIRPPTDYFEFTYIHGITLSNVRTAPAYRDIHAEVLERMAGASFIAAHNASFDKSVMNALCLQWQLDVPPLPWQCTVKFARKTWGIFPTKLPDVCNHLKIPLVHHDAQSDALACANIVIRGCLLKQQTD